MKVQVAVLGFPSLTVSMVYADAKRHLKKKKKELKQDPAERHAAREVARYVIHKRRMRI